MSSDLELGEPSGGEEREDRTAFPFFLLLGVALGALASLFVTVLRRLTPPRPDAIGMPRPAATPSSKPPARVQAAAGGARAPADAAAPAGTPSAKTAPAQARTTRWPLATKYVVGVILFLAVVALVYVSRSVIPPVIFAALLAFVVHPLVRFFQRRLKLKRGLAVGLTYLLVVAALLLIPLVLIPSIVSAVNSFIGIDYQAAIEEVQNTLLNLSTRVAAIPVINAIVGPILDSILKTLVSLSSAQAPEPVSYTVPVTEVGSLLAKAVGGLGRILGPVISAVTSVVFMVLISVYVSLSSDQIRSWYPKLIPPGYEPEISGLFGRVGGIWASFLRSQVLLMTLIGTVVWLGNLILGNHNALLLGVISGFLELIPNIGPALALIPGVLMALLFGSSHFAVSPWVFALIVVGFYMLVQFLENQFVVPHIMGDAVNLPPLVVILGTFVGGATVGLLGVFLATPVIATGREVFAYLYNKILEPPTVAGPPEELPSLLDSIRRLAGKIKLPPGLRWPRRAAKKGHLAGVTLPKAAGRGTAGEVPGPVARPIVVAPAPGTLGEPAEADRATAVRSSAPLSSGSEPNSTRRSDFRAYPYQE